MLSGVGKRIALIGNYLRSISSTQQDIINYDSDDVRAQQTYDYQEYWSAATPHSNFPYIIIRNTRVFSRTAGYTLERDQFLNRAEMPVRLLRFIELESDLIG
jgi:glutaredoxin